MRAMIRVYLVRGAVIGAASLAALLSPLASFAQSGDEWVARAATVQGTVEVRRIGETQWQPVKLNDSFRPGDTIRVQERSRADLALRDQSVLRLNANTTMTVEAVAESRTWVVDLLRGAAYFLSSGPRRLTVKTGFATAGVRGTEFYVGVEADKAVFTIFEGTVVAQNETGTLTLTGGQSAVAVAGKAPGLLTVVRPRDAVQWAMYYPPVLYFAPEELSPATDWRGAVLKSMEQQRSGDLQKAFDAIAGVPDSVTEPRFFAYRASLLLAVGRVDGAGADIGRALRLAPNDANALALQAIIAVVQGENDKALASAQSSVQAAPTSATAHIALSYARQARFDLEGARLVLQTAVILDPKNALAWARLAELHSSVGELDQSLEAAQKAVELEPNLSRTQTILGYAYLTQVKTGPAKAAFEKALALDQADPLPRLGLGLAKIREGDLSGGTADIEIASLDPNNALVRSYLGKAYFEQKRDGLDEREFRVAKGLDPKDPTPWFYDAIRKQLANQPVEALQDMESAIALNDNRAVYRSRLLLESDEAARSASQARIFSDLGFQQRALVEGWKSVDTDPTNSSAHRFLSDSYSALPRHEVARVSELLQSQLLQPLNMTPIQPRLTESNLGVIGAGGPGSLSFNEYTPLFNRNGVNVQANGLAGEHNTRAGEVVVAGIYEKASFSIGGSRSQTDGFRVNADQKDDIASAFLQLQFTPDTSIQTEYRYRKSERGDVQLRFFENSFSPDERNTAKSDYYRIGLRHNLAPDSVILANVGYRTKHEDSIDNVIGLDFTDDSKATGGEVQHLFRSKYVNLVSGVGYFSIKETLALFDTSVAPPAPIFSIPADITHTNGYVYSYIHLPQDVTAIIGASGDSVKAEDPKIGDKTLFNPKIGVIWNPVPTTTLRAAAFRTLKRTLIVDQTLEPTQVAGFNQFYDDFNGTEAWKFGVAIDQKLSQGVYAGAEFSKRDLKVPFLDDVTDPANPVRTTVNWNERFARGYLFWTPHKWVALRAEYLYEYQERDPLFTFGFSELTTQRVPLGINIFHPSGFSAALTGTYYDQKGLFDASGPQLESDTFWIVDAKLGYRLPKRYGLFTIGVANLTNQQFRYFNTDAGLGTAGGTNATIQPGRMAFARLTLTFP